MRAHPNFTFEKACKALWIVETLGWTQTRTAQYFGVNQGIICHVVHGRRFQGASPVPAPEASQ